MRQNIGSCPRYMVCWQRIQSDLVKDVAFQRVKHSRNGKENAPLKKTKVYEIDQRIQIDFVCPRCLWKPRTFTRNKKYGRRSRKHANESPEHTHGSPKHARGSLKHGNHVGSRTNYLRTSEQSVTDTQVVGQQWCQSWHLHTTPSGTWQLVVSTTSEKVRLINDSESDDEWIPETV